MWIDNGDGSSKTWVEFKISPSVRLKDGRTLYGCFNAPVGDEETAREIASSFGDSPNVEISVSRIATQHRVNLNQQ